MSHRAMDLLIEDPNTRTILIVSKPAGRDAMAALIAHAESSSKPVVFGMLGEKPYEASDHVRVVGSLEAASAVVAGLYGGIRQRDRDLDGRNDGVHPRRVLRRKPMSRGCEHRDRCS